MVRMDTHTAVTSFFKLSQNDFVIDSKSKISAEKAAYTSLKSADAEGGNPDGLITYSEYLTYLNKNTPNSISAYDFALAKVLPELTGFSFIQKDGTLAVGTLSRDIKLGKDLVLPAGAKIALMDWGVLRVNLPGDSIFKGIPVRGSKDIFVEFACNSDGSFFLNCFQLAKDTVISGVPCKAVKTDAWDISTQLHSSGLLERATLSADYTASGLSFLAGETIQFYGSGLPAAAVLARDREFQGRTVVAYAQAFSDRKSQGLFGGNSPDIFFEQGIIKMCYEKDKNINGVVIPGTNQYHYAADGVTVTGISPTDAYFWGYPVAISKLQQPWDWNMPKPTITVSEGKATFVLDVALQISGKAGTVTLSAGSNITIDILTGNCLAVVQADGKNIAYDAMGDQMKPVQVPIEQRPMQISSWMEQWLVAHPEGAAGVSPELRQAHIVLRDKMRLIEKIAETNRLYKSCLDNVLLYKNKADGLIAGNVVLDLNGDGKMQDSEIVPRTLLNDGEMFFSLEKLFGYFVENISSLPIAKLKALGEVMSSIPISSAAENLGVFDGLGAILSKAGIHPFAKMNIYYLPNGSGEKLYCSAVEFYVNGVPKKMVIDNSIKDINISLPGIKGKVKIVLYDKDRLAKENLNNTYWANANQLEFWDTGEIQRIGNVPFMAIPIDPAYGCAQSLIETHAVRWYKDGSMAELLQAGNTGFSFNFPQGIVVNCFNNIIWPRTVTPIAIMVRLNRLTTISVVFTAGKHTFYRIDQKTGAVVAREVNFAKDTRVNINGGFCMDSKGNIIDYWNDPPENLYFWFNPVK